MNETTKVLYQYAKKYKGKFVLLYMCLAVESLIQSIIPLFIAKIVDVAVYSGDKENFLMVSLYYGLCLLAFGIFSAIHPNIWQYLMNRYVFDIRLSVYNSIINAKASYLANMKSGDLMARIDNDVTECMHIIQRNVFHYVNYIIKLIIVLVAVFYFNIVLGCVIVALIPVFFVMTRKFGKRAESQSEEERRTYGSYISWLMEMLRGIREIKLLSAEQNVLHSFEERYQNVLKANNKISVLGVIVEQTRECVNQIINCILFCVLAFLVVKNKITIGEATAILTYYTIIKQCVTAISNNSMQKKWRSACIHRICEIIFMDVEQEQKDKKELVVTDGLIEFKEVSFSYEDSKSVLENLDLKVTPKKHLCIVGLSGSGKSTIAQLLLKFYEPQYGKILIDGQDISESSFRSLRKQIGIVLQDVIIFKGTIRFNLALANKDATEEEMKDALKKASLWEYISKLPMGLDTELTYGGKELSGGQRQRLSIARVYLKKAKIIIFDEATSALDNESERAICEEYANITDKCTTISIAHRLSTITHCDEIAVLDKGKIVGHGDYLTMLKENEMFQYLFKEQYLAEGGILE